MDHVLSPIIQRSNRSLLTGAIAAAASFFITPPIAGQLLEQTQWIVGGVSSFAMFGSSVAISGDTMIAGAPLEDGIGSAHVYVRVEGIWAFQQKLIPSDDGISGDQFGSAVAIDGDTVVVGAPNRNSGQDAAAYVFVRSGQSWTPQQIVEPSVAGAGFGRSIGVSGNTAVFSANEIEGGAHVYVRSGSAWSHQQHIDASDAGVDPNIGSFGKWNSISGDSIVIGGYTDSAFVFARSAGVWSFQDELVLLNPNSPFGRSVSISGDTAIVGEYDGLKGSATVFLRSGSTWSPQAYLTAPDAALDDDFGFSVALDRGVAVVGAYLHNHGGGNRGGAAYVFRRRGGAWFPEWELLQTVPEELDLFGVAVAIKGTTVLVGSPQDDWLNIITGPVTDGGSVYEFQPYLFIDGFESGDTTEWSNSVP